MIIRDAVHGDIALTADQQRLLDTPEMQRLRGIKQTGTAHLVYPGCTHTRFEHSLGTAHVAGLIMDRLAVGCPEAEVERYRPVVAAAALIHDVTHVPYGHTFEDERAIFGRHDRPERFVARLAATGFGRSLGDVLRRLSLFEPVLALLSRCPADAGLPAWTAQLVSGAIDADLLDYLRRDAHCSGIHQTYDERVFSYFTIASGQLALTLTRHGIDRPDARSELMHLLRLRYFLTERLYLHHAKVAAGAMIARAVELACAYGLTPSALTDLTDEGLLALLATYPRADVAALAAAVGRRELLKRAYAVRGVRASGEADPIPQPFRDYTRPELRDATEHAIAAVLGLPPEQVIISCPARSSFKEAAVPVLTAAGLTTLDAADSPAADEIAALKRQYRELWTFYVFVPADCRQAALDECERRFALRSDYRLPGGE